MLKINEAEEVVERLRNGLTAKATGNDYPDKDYKEDKRVLSEDSHIYEKLPSFVRTCRTTSDFFEMMKSKFKRYAERREYISQEFQPVFNYLEHVNNGSDIFSNNAAIYELGEKIGEGGFGTVYKYNHKLLEIDFAIKIFEPIFVSNEENTNGEKRFFQEAKMLFQLNHENIIRVYDIGRIYNKPFIRMEFIDGDTLQGFISKKGPVSFERSKIPITALLNGLCHAHKTKVIHRDLKPTNVMFTKDGKFKIIDFGISAYLENENYSKLTKTGERVAGGRYTDPALESDPKLKDPRSDIYSVGAIWYYLLTGFSPASDAKKTLLATGRTNELECSIILKCLESNLDDRYKSCEEILKLLNPSKGENSKCGLELSNKLTELTKERICDYLTENNYEEYKRYIENVLPQYQQPEKIFYFSGRKNEIDFLNPLYDLKNMPSIDPRFKTFEEEIKQHTIINNNYSYGWVFNDERLNLKNGNDGVLLNFLCRMFHPMIRSEKSDWQTILWNINELIKIDGYEIYESDKISGAAVYSYRFSI